MRNLIVVGFPGKRRAAEVLRQLEELHNEWTMQLVDAVAAYRTDDGRLRVDENLNLTEKEGGRAGGVIGALLGAVIAAPFTAGASVAVAATALVANAAAIGALGAAVGADRAATFKETYGVSDQFVKEVGGLVAVGDSAVFAEIDATNPEEIAQHFRGYGGTILRTTLLPGEAAEVQKTIGA